MGRVPLPVYASHETPIRPATLLTVISNRHYVTPELNDLIISSAKTLQKKHMDIRVLYLDANFPFIDGFPLLPHLSHDGGRKLDITFFYKNQETGNIKFGHSPSWLGYGICEEPEQGETDQPAICGEKGYWQYSILKKLTPHFRKKNFVLEEKLTADFLKTLTRNPKLRKVFIEPHLKERLGLTNNKKIRFHGCHAVRHDDHIHIEI